MANNLLDQLQQNEVPPPPHQMQREVHQRLNQWLLASQTVELLVHGFGYAALHFGSAVLGMINLTVTGNFQFDRTSKEENNSEDQ